MSNSKQKKTKEDFTKLLLGEDSSPDKTVVLPEDKTTALPDVSDGVFSAQKNNIENKKLEDSMVIEPVAIVKEETKKTSTESVTVEKSKLSQVQDSKVVLTPHTFDSNLISIEAALKQSEHLRLAQDKIRSLENKLDEYIKENETLASSAHVLQKKYDEMYVKYDNLFLQNKSDKESFKDELIFKDRVILELERQSEVLKRKNEEFESIMNERIQKVRIRERELMNRLELLQLQEDAVISNKDEVLLDLKKQMDRLNYEIENYKVQGRQLNTEIQAQKETIRKTVKALKLALNLLEHEDAATEDLKKTGS